MFKQRVITIDPGHGGEDFGAVGSFSNEKDINLRYANGLYDLLMQDERFIPMMTRDRDVDLALGERVISSKVNNSDVFISIHCNSSEYKKANDTQIYYYNDIKDRPLAELILAYSSYVDGVASKWSRSIFGDFYVLRKQNVSTCSSVLIEIAFISNDADEQKMNNPDFECAFVNSIYDGVKAFFNLDT